MLTYKVSLSSFIFDLNVGGGSIQITCENYAIILTWEMLSWSQMGGLNKWYQFFGLVYYFLASKKKSYENGVTRLEVTKIEVKG